MNCIITVKGDGVGRYGKTKTDRTGPIRDFLMDNQVLYTAVLRHVRECALCDPVAIFMHYLERRRNLPKHHGKTSRTFINLALKYEKICAERKTPLDKGLIHECYWRCSDFALLEECYLIIGAEGVLKGMMLIKDMDKRGNPDPWRPGKLFLRASDACTGTTIPTIALILDNALESWTEPDLTELENLIKVAEVMLS